MKNVICDYFKDKKNKILIIEHKKKNNILYDWPKVRFPMRITLNYLIIKFNKIAPLWLKIFTMRHILGVKIGKNVALAPEAEIDPFYPELIEIEDNAVIGMDSYILTHEFMQGAFRFARVKICKGALISAFCTIRSGVTIGEGSQVAMCSFVNKDIPPHELWGGIPARKIKSLKKIKKKR